MKSKDLTLGSKVQYLDGQGNWKDSIIYKTSEYFVWFKGMGYARIKRTDFETMPKIYKIISI